MLWLPLATSNTLVVVIRTMNPSSVYAMIARRTLTKQDRCPRNQAVTEQTTERNKLLKTNTSITLPVFFIKGILRPELDGPVKVTANLV